MRLRSHTNRYCVKSLHKTFARISAGNLDFSFEINHRSCILWIVATTDNNLPKQLDHLTSCSPTSTISEKRLEFVGVNLFSTGSQSTSAIPWTIQLQGIASKRLVSPTVRDVHVRLITDDKKVVLTYRLIVAAPRAHCNFAINVTRIERGKETRTYAFLRLQNSPRYYLTATITREYAHTF